MCVRLILSKRCLANFCANLRNNNIHSSFQVSATQKHQTWKMMNEDGPNRLIDSAYDLQTHYNTRHVYSRAQVYQQPCCNKFQPRPGTNTKKSCNYNNPYFSYCCLFVIGLIFLTIWFFVRGNNSHLSCIVEESCYILNYLSSPGIVLGFYDVCFTDYGSFINSGTPNYIDINTDCAIRSYAYQYGKQIQPRHGSFKHLYDALQLHVCGIELTDINHDYDHVNGINEKKSSSRSVETSLLYDQFQSSVSNPDCMFYVNSNPNIGDDLKNNGSSKDTPFLTIEKAINATRLVKRDEKKVRNYPCTINLIAGTRYYLQDTIILNNNDSYLTIQTFAVNLDSQSIRNNSIISGGKPLEFVESDWQIYNFTETKWYNFSNYNNIYGVSGGGDRIKFNGYVSTFDQCFDLIVNNSHDTYYSLTFDQASGECFGIRDISWQPIYQSGFQSSRLIGSNIWYRTVSNLVDFKDDKLYGLRVNQKRAIEARFPDADPETSMQYNPWSGYISHPTKTGKQKLTPSELYTFSANDTGNITDDGNILWPMHYPTLDNMNDKFNRINTGMGDWGEFAIGKGGTCDSNSNISNGSIIGGVDPPCGYFCNVQAPRVTSGGDVHNCPKSIFINQTLIPQSVDYTGEDISDQCIVHAFHPATWYTWMFECGEYNATTGELQFKKGGFQASQGSNDTGFWYISNIFSELTMPNEYYLNQTSKVLYYYQNNSNCSYCKIKPSTTTAFGNNDTSFVGTNLDVLINITDGAHNITIRGITFRDTRHTYLDSHGLPSGGDWALSRKGAIVLENTSNITIEYNTFTRLDGIGIFLNGYNRYANISFNDFEWIGESAMAAWGYTSGLEHLGIDGMGPDGITNINQPRFTNIESNLIREIGIWEKQSSAWFQAQSCQNTIKNNIVFNGPRAHINFNDGFGGGNRITGNLLLNSCRQTADHGVFNSWDRVPYVTNVKQTWNDSESGGNSNSNSFNNISGSIIPEWNEIDHNFIIGNYFSMISIDNDDGSAYYKTHDNFLVYSGFGIKSDFGGHDNRHFNNIYAFTDQSMFLVYAGANDWFIKNKVILNNECGYQSTCRLNEKYAFDMVVDNNSIYTPNGQIGSVCGMSFKQWQANGNDVLTKVFKWPSNEQLIDMVQEMLQQT